MSGLCGLGGSFVGFGGSRGLPSVASPGGLVSQVVASVVSSGRGVAVGCASGADAAVLSARLALGFPAGVSCPSLAVFAVGGPSGRGFWRCSALPVVRQAAALVGSRGHGVASPVAVSWWAGGGPSVPLRARLRRRSVALVQAVAASGSGAAFVAFVSGGFQASRGSWGSVRSALSLGLPVVVFPVGCRASCFPRSFRSVGSVRWVPAAQSGVWARGFRVQQGAAGA